MSAILTSKNNDKSKYWQGLKVRGCLRYQVLILRYRLRTEALTLTSDN